MKSRTRLLAFLTLLGCPGLAADDTVLRLPIGDPERSDHEVPLVLDAITDSRTGELLTPAQLPARLAGVDILLIGESHTSAGSHRVQQRVVDELDRAGRRVVIGLEMFPYTRQEPLDRWVAGHYSEQGFLEISDWYEIWGHHWGYYRDLFLLARERGIAMFAINTPREVVTAVREKGFEDLSEEEAAHIPKKIDTESADHLRLFKAYFDDDDPIHTQMTEDAWKSMLRAQCTWDATMGFNAVKSFEGLAGEGLAGEGLAGEGSVDAARAAQDTIMVVLAGSGHVAYGLGIERQMAQWFDGQVALLIPVAVRDDGELVESVQASYADYLWGLPEETGPFYPVLGIATRESDDGRRKVIHVAEDSPAERGGFEIGDLLLTVDGVEVSSKGGLNRLMAGKQWGDAVSAAVARDGKTVVLEVLLRRVPVDAEEGEHDAGERGDEDCE